MSDLKSVVSLSIHKGGSTILDRILMSFIREKGYEPDRISQSFPGSAKHPQEILAERDPDMPRTGYYFGMIRTPHFKALTTALGELRVIAQVRDPRDCLTSAFFSFGISHKLPDDPAKREEFLKQRQKIIDNGIDPYVIDQAAGVRNRFMMVADLQKSHDDMLLLKYEDMVLNTEAWLEQIAGFLDQPLNAAVRKSLGDKIDFTVKEEDVTSHKRQVTPGDHMRKLKPETIAELDRILAEPLDHFGYPRG